MKTLRLPASSPSKLARVESKAVTRSARHPKFISCGTNRQLTRAEIMAEDAAYLARMSGGEQASRNAIELVREGR